MNSFRSGRPLGRTRNHRRVLAIVKNPPPKSIKYLAIKVSVDFHEPKSPHDPDVANRSVLLQFDTCVPFCNTRSNPASRKPVPHTGLRPAVTTIFDSYLFSRFQRFYKRFIGKHLQSKTDADAGPLLNAGPLTETATSPLATDRRGSRRPLFLGDGSALSRNSCANQSRTDRNSTLASSPRLGITCQAHSRN